MRRYDRGIASPTDQPDSSHDRWTFFTNHALVLLAIAADPRARIRDITERVGITERAVRRIIADLVGGGYVSRRREGRRNVYVIYGQKRLRHPIVRHQTVGSMLAGLVPEPPPEFS